METVMMVLFVLTAVLLVLLVLIQKGRGGGLAGAFGGPGGSSAFGTKTADVLTKLTAGLGAAFFLIALVTALVMRGGETDALLQPAPPGETAPAEGPDAGGAPPVEPEGAGMGLPELEPPPADLEPDVPAADAVEAEPGGADGG